MKDRFAIRPVGPVQTPIQTPQPVLPSLTLPSLKQQVDLLGSQLTLITEATHAINCLTHVHSQDVPAAVWVINHNFTGKFPSVTVVDSAGSEVVGDVRYTGPKQVTLSFAVEFSGKAYLN